MTPTLHDDEIPIDTRLVRDLVTRALPRYAACEVRPLGRSGSSNALFRLGEDLLVRLPRQPGGSVSIDKEARWLPVIGPGLPLQVPRVVAVAEPDLGYPERWSVVEWIDGNPAAVVDPAAVGLPGIDLPELAKGLAELVVAFGRLEVSNEAKADPDLRWYRGEPLAALDEQTRADLDRCRAIPGLDLNLDVAQQVWDEAVALPKAGGGADSWYHGDLLAENLLVRDGRLAAVLDFGGVSVGDPTVDLIVAWEVLDPPSRRVFREALGVDDATWLKGRAWALALALMTFPYYWDSMPSRCASRRAMAEAVLLDAAG